MSQAASKNKLDILTSPAFKDRIVGKAKGIGIYNYMIGEPKKCCFSLAVAVAVEEKKRGDEIKAILALERATQEMLNFIWDSLHPFDQEKVRAERLNDDLPQMWKNLQIIPDKSTLNQLLQSILKLECGTLAAKILTNSGLRFGFWDLRQLTKSTVIHKPMISGHYEMTVGVFLVPKSNETVSPFDRLFGNAEA